MPPTRSRTAGFAAALSVSMALAGLSMPVAAADSPEAAVNGFFDIAQSGDFSNLDSVVCASDVDSVRKAFDLGASLGLADDDPAASALSIEVTDRGVELLSEDGDEATVRVTATMSMSVAEDEMEGLVRAILAADLGPDDPPPSDDDVEMMLGFMSSAFNQTMPLDEEVTVVREDGEWLVCGGLVEEPEGPDYGVEPSVSSEGVCALATPEELSALGPLTYDSSTGFETFCNYSNSDFDNYHQTGVSIDFDVDAQYTAQAYGADQELTVGGAQAWAPGPDGFGTNLITQVGADMIVVTVGVPETPPDGFDWLTQATLITELLMPRLEASRVELVGPTPAPTPEPTPEIPLCQEAWMDELNEATGLGFDLFESYADSCQFMSVDMDPGFHIVYVYVLEAMLDDYLAWLPEGFEETTIAGQRTVVSDSMYLTEMPDGQHLLQVTAGLDENDESLSVTPEEVVALLVERIFSGTTATEPS